MTLEVFEDNVEDSTIAEANIIQSELKNKLILEDRLPTIDRVAGVDVSYNLETGMSQAAIAVLSFPNLELITHAIGVCPTSFPYIPGYLSFREIPAILEALKLGRVIS